MTEQIVVGLRRAARGRAVPAPSGAAGVAGRSVGEVSLELGV
jgi:hypothetical protein